jgi:alpha,alpha-trehalase
MVDNFSYLIDTLGFIPNGNRTYYLGRSQPPFYAAMVSLLAEIQGDSVRSHYLPFLEKEYAFWMDGADKLNEEFPTHRRVVRLPGGEVLNRYWDDFDTPRPESYLEDVETASAAVERFPNVMKEEVYRDLRAAAESGWDFSSRWLSPDEEGRYALYTIHTTDIIPVDLNSLLYNLEYTIYRAYLAADDTVQANDFLARAKVRKEALTKYCWDEEEGFFEDYNFVNQTRTGVLAISGLYPLFFQLANTTQASAAARAVENRFLKPGGVPATLNATGQQWDAPNGWAPLQWITVQGLTNYEQDELADEVASRWLGLNEDVYERTLKFTEKYNVEDLSMSGGGGEYPNQDGFGWTNGVFQQMRKQHRAIVLE